MLIQADISSDKTIFLAKKYIELLNKGVLPSSIIFLVQNSYRKNFVINFLKSAKIDYSAVNTFQGLIFRTINNNWEFISSKI